MRVKKKSPKRQFKGIWIPSRIWNAKDLTPTEKFLLAEIHSFSREGGECFGSNKFFGKRFGVSEGTIANMLTSLRKKRYIRTRKFDGRKRTLEITKW